MICDATEIHYRKHSFNWKQDANNIFSVKANSMSIHIVVDLPMLSANGHACTTAQETTKCKKNRQLC